MGDGAPTDDEEGNGKSEGCVTEGFEASDIGSALPDAVFDRKRREVLRRQGGSQRQASRRRGR
jgi:hypothetical protein